jgi:exopolysaccharide biosynthesis polyprenyl glycosylphosphotransferase
VRCNIEPTTRIERHATLTELIMSFSVSIPLARSRSDRDKWLPAAAGHTAYPRTARSSRARRRADYAVVGEHSPIWRAAKRAVDFVGAACGLLCLAPLLITTAMVIKVTSPGPVFFRQKRHGYHNRRFWIYKFRTMYTDLGDQSGTRQTTRDDPRVTPIGRLLRKTNVDELPQLINVLKGDMSLVGPRPHVPGMLAGGLQYEELLPYYFQRHNMRPGITGLAQVNGLRGSTAAPESAIERLDHDLRYIEAWSFWLDIRILMRTIAKELVSSSGD